MEPHDGADSDAQNAPEEDQISSGDTPDPGSGGARSPRSGRDLPLTSEAAPDGAVADSAVVGSAVKRWNKPRASAIWSRGVDGLARLRRPVLVFVARGGVMARRVVGRPVRWWAVARQAVPAMASAQARALRAKASATVPALRARASAQAQVRSSVQDHDRSDRSPASGAEPAVSVEQPARSPDDSEHRDDQALPAGADALTVASGDPAAGAPPTSIDSPESQTPARSTTRRRVGTFIVRALAAANGMSRRWLPERPVPGEMAAQDPGPAQLGADETRPTEPAPDEPVDARDGRESGEPGPGRTGWRGRLRGLASSGVDAGKRVVGTIRWPHLLRPEKAVGAHDQPVPTTVSAQAEPEQRQDPDAAGAPNTQDGAGEAEETPEPEESPEREETLEREETPEHEEAPEREESIVDDGAEVSEGAPPDDPVGPGPTEPARPGSTGEDRRAGLAARSMAAANDIASRPGQWRAAARQASQARLTARSAAEQAARVQREMSHRQAQQREAAQAVAQRRERRRRTVARLIRRDKARRVRRRRIMLTLMIAPLIVAAGLAVAAYYVDTIPAPAELALPESTTIYYADGTTPMARLGTENRTIVGIDDMNAAVKQAIVAAEDRTFWFNRGVNLSSVVRAAWNNVTGGAIQGGSTITQQYVRIAADLKGVTFARKSREAMLAWKMDHSYSKEKILDFYLNTVPFGRGAYGIEAAAQAYFGKTTRRDAPQAQQITVSEAMVLASVVKQPEPDPSDPVGHPGYDPARGGTAAANALMRWQYVRDGMVTLGYLTDAEAAALQFPHTVRPLDLSVPDNGLDRPTGLVVDHVLSELRLSQPFANQSPDYIRNGGFRIVTTVDKRAQDAAEAAADIRRVTAPEVDRGQPADWQAALVAIEPGTGRVLAYYGGNAGTGADFAGWYYDATGQAHGYGEHPPGSSFKVYDLAEALRQGISLSSHWDSPAVKEFPNSGRTNKSPTGPVRNSSTADCQPDCTLLQATVASLNVPFFDLTERLGPASVVDMAAKAGIDSMWTDPTAQQQPVRVDLVAKADKDLVANPPDASVKQFSTEVGIGQYGVTVLDHANGMATFAAGGERAQAHFVRAVYRHGDLVYAEQLTQSPIGLTPAQIDQLTSALSQVPSAKLPNGWDAAGKTGTWQAGNSLTENAHTWMVGYTRALAVAVWLGTTDGKALKTKDGKTDVFGSTYAAPIWRQFIVDATAAMNLDPQQKAFSASTVATTPSPLAPSAH